MATVAVVCEAQTVEYAREDSVKVETLLAGAPKEGDMNAYMMYFAKQLLGTPYVAKTLDGSKGAERLVVNLRQLDCTTFVETILALSRCARAGETTFNSYCDALRCIRYDECDVSYERRLHYFSQWIASNEAKGFVSEGCQDSLPGALFDETQTLKINYMSSHTSEYPQLRADTALVGRIKTMEVGLTGKKYRYIPRRLLQRNTKGLRRYVRDGDIIALVTSKTGLDIAHVGLASWHADGTLHLINASQIHKKVIDEPMTLYNYMAQHPSQIGIRVVRPM